MKQFLFTLLIVSLCLVPLTSHAMKISYGVGTDCNANYNPKDTIYDPVTHWKYFIQSDSTSVFLYFYDYGRTLTHRCHPDSLVVPSTITAHGKTYNVVGIANACFSISGYQIKKIILPESVKYIDTYGFSDCDSLIEIHGPGVELCGEMAFWNNYCLKVVDLPNLKYFGPRTFGNCQSLESLTLPSLLRHCDGTDCFQAFEGCINLKYLSCPKLEELIEQEFIQCNSLRHYYFPSVKKYIEVSGGGLFYMRDSVVNYVNLPNLETPVDQYTFGMYPYVKDIDTIIVPKVKTFRPFYLRGIKYLDIGNVVADSLVRFHQAPGVLYQDHIQHIVCYDTSVLYWLNYQQEANYQNFNYHIIEKNPYYPYDYSDCNDYPGFETVELTHQTEMVDTAFMHIPNVKHLVLHKGCTAYNPKAFFTYLKGLQDITVKSDNEVFKDHHGVLYSKDDELLYYPLCNETTTDSQGKERPWDLLNYRTTGVGPYALYNYKGTEPSGDYHHEIHISKGETCEIGEHAMDGSSVDHVTFDLDAPLTTVSQYAFANMTQTCFRYLKMPSALTTIEQNAFSGDTQLQALEVYNTALTSVGDNAFAGQTAITSIALPNSVTTIGKEAFKGNTAMTYFTMPKHCTSLGDEAFSGCSADLIIKIPETSLTSDNLSAAFASTDTKAKLLVPSEKQGDFNGWSFDAATKTVNIPANRYVSFTRSYPISITDTTGVKWTRFYRAVGIEDKKNDNGQYVIKLKRLYAKDLKLIPANSPILMYFEHIDRNGNKLPDSSTATESFNYSICANTNDVTYSENSPVKAAPGAIRMDRQETDYDGNDYYTNFILSSSDSNTGTYDLVADNPWYDVATRTGEKSYLHFPGDGTDTKAKGFVFSIDNSYDDPFATGIKDIKGNTSKVNDDAWYTLSGSRTSKPQHGIYIHNGKKKIVIK